VAVGPKGGLCVGKGSSRTRGRPMAHGSLLSHIPRLSRLSFHPSLPSVHYREHAGASQIVLTRRPMSQESGVASGTRIWRGFKPRRRCVGLSIAVAVSISVIRCHSIRLCLLWSVHWHLSNLRPLAFMLLNHLVWGEACSSWAGRMLARPVAHRPFRHHPITFPRPHCSQ
jgi:hypothetical protein